MKHKPKSPEQPEPPAPDIDLNVIEYMFSEEAYEVSFVGDLSVGLPPEVTSFAEAERYAKILLNAGRELLAALEAARAEIEHWRTKAECYGSLVHGCDPALKEAGFDFGTRSGDTAKERGENIADAIRIMKKERDEARAQVARLCSEFLDWLLKRYWLCKVNYRRDEFGSTQEQFAPAQFNPEELLAEFFDIDLKKLNKEREEILEKQRELNDAGD